MGALGAVGSVRNKPLSRERGVECRVEWLGGRAKVHLTFLTAEGFEIAERQLAQLGIILVSLPSQVPIGVPIKVSLARSHGRAPLVVSGCVVYEMPRGAAIKLDFSSDVVKAKWEALKRVRASTISATRKAHKHRAKRDAVPTGVFHICHAGIDVYYKDGAECVMTLRLKGPQTLGRFHKALQQGEMLLAPSCVDAGIGEAVVVRLMATSLDEVCFGTRVVCRTDEGTIIEPVGLSPQLMVQLGELGRAMLMGDRTPTQVDSSAMPALSRTPASGPIKPLARTQPMQPLPRQSSSPEIVVPAAIVRETKPAPKPLPLSQSRPTAPRPLSRPRSRSARKPQIHPQVQRLIEQAEGMGSLNPWEILGIHWSAYDKVIAKGHEDTKARFNASKYPPEIYKQAAEALDTIHACIDKARDDLDTHLKRLVERKRIIDDQKQIDSAIEHYLERAKMAAWRGNRAEAYDAYRRIYEVDPLNEEARKRFKKKGV